MNYNNYYYLFLILSPIIIVTLEKVHGRTILQRLGENVTISSHITPQPRPDPQPNPQVHCYAVVRTVLDHAKHFYGANGFPNLYKPHVRGHQWSASRIKLMNGPDSIEAGWIVYPDYFKDNEAHLYVKFSVGSKECFNSECPGFVQVSPDTRLGSSPREYSNVGGKQVGWNISIEKDFDDGNWWLAMMVDAITFHRVGYWPGNLFTELKIGAAQVDWGGEINNPSAVSPAPSMGSSLKATYDLTSSANFQHITVVNESSYNIIPQGTEKINYCPELYTVLDWGDRGANLGRVIFYGGS